MIKLDRISIDPARLNGQPTMRNLRLTVRRVIELLALYLDRQELHREYSNYTAVVMKTGVFHRRFVKT